MGKDTPDRLIEAALATIGEQGIAKASARTIAATAGVNQALIFYHFKSLDDLLVAACRAGARERIEAYRDELRQVRDLRGLLAFAHRMHEAEQAAPNVAILAQLLAGAQTHAVLREPTSEGLRLWAREIQIVLDRVLAAHPLGEAIDSRGFARAVAAAFVGIELYGGVDRDGADAAIGALTSLGEMVALVEDLGPVAERTLRRRLRKRRTR